MKKIRTYTHQIWKTIILVLNYSIDNVWSLGFNIKISKPHICQNRLDRIKTKNKSGKNILRFQESWE